MFRLFLTTLTLILLMACKEEAKQIESDQLTQEANSLKTVGQNQKVFREELPEIDLVMGRFNPATDTNFIKIDAAYTDKPVIFLQKEAYKQFIRMHDAALADGLELRILSATRSFDYQKNIWERKWINLQARGMSEAKNMVSEILKYSAMPGTSRHHWGTEIDLNYLSNANFESGKGKELYQWLSNNANTFGFCQPYTKKGENRPYGYEEEKWHWSYMPIAEKYYKSARANLKNEMITGFSGAEFADSLGVVQHYVFGVDPKCK